MSEIKEKIIQLITDVQVIETEPEDKGLHAIIDYTQIRPLAEITDQLWTIFKCRYEY